MTDKKEQTHLISSLGSSIVLIRCPSTNLHVDSYIKLRYQIRCLNLKLNLGLRFNYSHISTKGNLSCSVLDGFQVLLQKDMGPHLFCVMFAFSVPCLGYSSLWHYLARTELDRMKLTFMIKTVSNLA